MGKHLDDLPSYRTTGIRKSPLKFFLIAFALIIPFWALGAVTELQLLPGLPVAALATFCPMVAAIIVVYQENKRAGVTALLKRSFDFKRIKKKIWYLPVVLVMPIVMMLSFGVMRLSGVSVPAPQIAVLPALALCAVFFIGALGEELGWSGYATDAMQERWGALQTSIILGLIWVIYHYVGLAQANRSIEWIVWWSLGTLALRVIIIWLYNNSGRSVFATALFHMTINVTWQLFPINGSYYDPQITGMITAIVAAIIVVVWARRSLVRNKHAQGKSA